MDFDDKTCGYHFTDIINSIFAFATGSPSSLEDRKDFLSISASSPSDSNDVDSMMLQSIPRKTVTSVQYRTEVRTLRNVPQINYTPLEFPYETKIHSIPDENAAEETVKERPTADHTARNRNNVRHTRHDKPRVTGHERPSQYGISKVSQHKMAAVHSIMRTSSRPRLKAAADQENGDKNGKSKRKDKKKRADSRAKEDSVDLVMSQSVVTGILAGSLVLLFCVTGFVWLW